MRKIMTTYFITRHAGALAWAKQQNLSFDIHLEHLLNLEQLQAGDVIIGTLPINLVYQLNLKHVRYTHLSLNIPSHLRGIELSTTQLDECQATLEEFFVQRI